MTDAPLPYEDRHHAGRVLAEKLARYRGRPKLIVLALPRGGVAVGFEVARALHAPLDVFVVRKLGFPGHEEYAMGAIASGGVRVMTPLPGLTVAPEAVAQVIAREQAELVRREQLYRSQRPPISLAGRTVIVVDDGLATGASMRAAVLAIRQQHPRRIWWWRCRWAPRTPAGPCGKRPMKWSAPQRRSRFARWDCGTRNFRRPATMKFARCWTKPAASTR